MERYKKGSVNPEVIPDANIIKAIKIQKEMKYKKIKDSRNKTLIKKLFSLWTWR